MGLVAKLKIKITSKTRNERQHELHANTEEQCFRDAEGVCPRVPELLIRSLILPSVTV